MNCSKALITYYTNGPRIFMIFLLILYAFAGLVSPVFLGFVLPSGMIVVVASFLSSTANSNADVFFISSGLRKKEIYNTQVLVSIFVAAVAILVCWFITAIVSLIPDLHNGSTWECGIITTFSCLIEAIILPYGSNYLENNLKISLTMVFTPVIIGALLIGLMLWMPNTALDPIIAIVYTVVCIAASAYLYKKGLNKIETKDF